MQATQHFNSPTPNGQPSQDFHNQTGENLITTRQALTIAARACNSLLFGEPHPATFDREDLSQTLAILSQMACTVEPEGGQP
jgi:hypothetical protein